MNRTSSPSQANKPATLTLIATLLVMPFALSGCGTLVGAGVGGVAGSMIGSGTGKTLATIGGAAAGAVIGHKVTGE